MDFLIFPLQLGLGSIFSLDGDLEENICFGFGLAKIAICQMDAHVFRLKMAGSVRGHF